MRLFKKCISTVGTIFWCFVPVHFLESVTPKPWPCEVVSKFAGGLQPALKLGCNADEIRCWLGVRQLQLDGAQTCRNGRVIVHTNMYTGTSAPYNLNGRFQRRAFIPHSKMFFPFKLFIRVNVGRIPQPPEPQKCDELGWTNRASYVALLGLISDSF